VLAILSSYSWAGGRKWNTRKGEGGKFKKDFVKEAAGDSQKGRAIGGQELGQKEMRKTTEDTSERNAENTLLGGRRPGTEGINSMKRRVGLQRKEVRQKKSEKDGTVFSQN